MDWSDRSARSLEGVDPRLAGIAARARELSPRPFEITEGLREIDRQKRLVAEGRSQTLNSRHLTGRALDFVVLNEDGSANWDFEVYREVSAAWKQAAAEAGVPITWGGDWESLRDGPHIQLGDDVPLASEVAAAEIEEVGEPTPNPHAPAPVRGPRTWTGSPIGTEALGGPVESGSFFGALSDAWADSGVALWTQRAGAEFAQGWQDDPEFDPFDAMVGAGRETDWRTLRFARSQAEFDYRLGQIDGARGRLARIASYDGWVAPMLGYMLQPEALASMVFLPGAGVAGSLGRGAAKGAFRLGASTALFETGAEALRRSEIPGIDMGESVMRVSAATVLTAALGGVVGGIRGARLRGLSRRHMEDVQALQGVGFSSARIGDRALDWKATWRPGESPRWAMRHGVWAEGDAVRVDAGRVSRSFAVKPWRALGFDDADFPNANAWTEFLVRYQVALADRGMPQFGETVAPGAARLAFRDGTFFVRSADGAVETALAVGAADTPSAIAKALHGRGAKLSALTRDELETMRVAYGEPGQPRTRRTVIEREIARRGDPWGEALDEASRDFRAWRETNRIELNNRVASAIHRMISSPFKRLHANGRAQEIIDLADTIAMDAGLAGVGAQAGRTTGVSLATASQIWMGRAHALVEKADAAYELHLGFRRNPRVLGQSTRRMTFSRTKANGDPAMSFLEFKRRAERARMLGVPDADDGVNQFARDLTEFYQDFSKHGVAVGALGQFDPTMIRLKRERVEARIAKNASKGIRSAEDAMKLAELQRLEVMARDLDLKPAMESDYSSRVWMRQMIRRYPKTWRTWLTTVLGRRKNIMLTRTVNGEKVQEIVPATRENIESLVDEITENIMARSDPADFVAPMSKGPSYMRERQLGIANREALDVTMHPDEGVGTIDFIETDGLEMAMTYAQRMGPQIEYARRFNDPAEWGGADAGFERRLAASRRAEAAAWGGAIGKSPGQIAFEARFERAKAARRAGLPDDEVEAILKERSPEDTGPLDDLRLAPYEGPRKAAFEKHWDALERDARMLRDRVTNRVVSQPDRWDNRSAEVLKQWAHLVFMGEAALAAVIDSGKLVMANGLSRTFRTAFEALDAQSSARFALKAGELKKAGGLLEIVRGTVARHFSEIGTDPIHITRFEKGLRGATSAFFIANLLSPVTYGLKQLDGAMRQHTIIEKVVAARKGDAAARRWLVEWGIDARLTNRIGAEVDAGRALRDTEGGWLANTDEWLDEEAVRAFRGALLQGVDNTILLASAADKPAIIQGVLHFRKSPKIDRFARRAGWADVGGYWRVQSGLLGLPFQFWNYGLAATNKILAAALERPSGQVGAGLAVMAGLGWMVHEIKTPSYVEEPIPDKLVKIIHQSGMTGLLTEFMFKSQNMIGSLTGVNPLPIGYQYSQDAPAFMDALFNNLGAGPSVSRNLVEGIGRAATGDPEAMRQLGWAIPGRNYPPVAWLLEDMTDSPFAAAGPPRF